MFICLFFGYFCKNFIDNSKKNLCIFFQITEDWSEVLLHWFTIITTYFSSEFFISEHKKNWENLQNQNRQNNKLIGNCSSCLSGDKKVQQMNNRFVSIFILLDFYNGQV